MKFWKMLAALAVVCVISVMMPLPADAATPKCPKKYSLPFMPDNMKVATVQLWQQPGTPNVCVQVKARKGYQLNRPTITWYDTKTGPAQRIVSGWYATFKTDDTRPWWSVNANYYNESTKRWGWENSPRFFRNLHF